MNTAKIVFAGNPNVGKSTVFNALTGLKQHTGNWSGKTVELTSGTFKTGDKAFEVYDLPGTYSVISNSPEETVARDFICFENPDLTVIVADATCLERNLNLALQIMEMNSRVLLCVNLIDEAARNGIFIDIDKLRKRLGIPVISICAKRSCDIKRLKNKIAELCSSEFEYRCSLKPEYPLPLETAASMISESLEHFPLSPERRRFIALKILDNPELGERLIEHCAPTDEELADIKSHTNTARDYLDIHQIPPIVLRDIIVESIIDTARSVAAECCTAASKISNTKSMKIDRILTSRKLGIPIMIVFFGFILWITLIGANYPSRFLSEAFSHLKPYVWDFLSALYLPDYINSLITDGIYGTVSWVIAVMLPPMAIFFPLFTLMEDFGYLPRIAFNLDKCFRRANSCGKQSLTMCMGLGCNAVGVMGCRIISSKSQRLAAIVTNTFMPCNGRFGMLTTLSAIFIGGLFCGGFSAGISALFVLLLIIIGVGVTLLVTKILTSTILKGDAGDFVLELPPFRRPELLKVLTRSLLDRTLRVLGRALSVSAPAGALIWFMANISICGRPIMDYCTAFLNPIGSIMGLDGTILFAFILALPANEIVLPIILMCYLSSSQMVDAAQINELGSLLQSNGWTTLTALNTMLFSLLHFPCATTLKTIKAETKSLKWTAVAFIVPTTVGMIVCIITNLIFNMLF